MSIWYAFAVVAFIIVSWVVANLYSDNCLNTEKNSRYHGALEFNATFFSLVMFLLAYASKNTFFLFIGTALGLIVIRRFWLNWAGSDKT